jgi:hypothetical protein
LKKGGRRWDVVFLLACAARRGADSRVVRFEVRARNGNRERTPPLVRLKAFCGPRGDGAPAITVMELGDA